jgi:flagellar motor switch protein FliN/FliY
MSTMDKLNTFFEEWTKEFGRAVEMFAGEKAVVACQEATSQEIAQHDLSSFSWSRQMYQGEDSFPVWTGVAEACWRELGGAMSENADGAEQAFAEMLSQAQHGTAAVISAGHARPFRCAEAENCEQPAIENLVACEISIEFRGQKLPPLILALEVSAAQAMAAKAPGINLPAERPRAGSEADLAEGSQMLGRLMEIDLPLSVALGRAVLPIRDILKMTPGTLIELDRHIGEFVDVVVQGMVVAHGEVVSVKGNYGIRIKEIISREDRLALRKQS